MTVAITTSLIMIMIIGYFSSKKALHLYEQYYLYFLLLIIYTCIYSFATVNLEIWQLSKEFEKLTAVRLNCIVLGPITYVNLMNQWLIQKKSLYKWAFLLGSTIWLLIADYTLRVNHALTYLDWNVWLTLVLWISIFVLTLFGQKLFRNLLRKEGFVT